MREDTIAAIATPTTGVGGIGVLRVSGDRSEEICRRLFRSRTVVPFFETHRFYHGDIINPDNGSIVDEAMVVLMRGPHSYTGEDVLEISCHGNPLILQIVLRSVLSVGARLADPGEFTKRAFLNNRIDLAQAEAVADLVTAKTEQGLKNALYTLKGGLSEKIELIRSSLLEVCALLEMSIDFTDEDIELPSLEGCSLNLDSAASAIEALLATYDRGTLLKNGMTAVIAGRPNVGKSSLFNRLVGRERAIVAEHPGTTRDFIEAEITLENLQIRFVDTAGIRESDHDIEREGVRYARNQATEADCVVVVVDGSEDLRAEDRAIIENNRNKELILAVNKCDLPPRFVHDELQQLVPECDVFLISAKENSGISVLKERIAMVNADRVRKQEDSDVALTNLRHKEALERAFVLIGRARERLGEKASPELPAYELGEALRHLSFITGTGAGDDVLDIIFNRFCVGK